MNCAGQSIGRSRVGHPWVKVLFKFVIYLTLGFAGMHDCSMEQFGIKRVWSFPGVLYISWRTMGNVVLKGQYKMGLCVNSHVFKGGVLCMNV